MKKIEFRLSFEIIKKRLSNYKLYHIPCKSLFNFFKKNNLNSENTSQSEHGNQNQTDENDNKTSNHQTETANPKASILSLQEASKFVEDKVK